MDLTELREAQPTHMAEAETALLRMRSGSACRTPRGFRCSGNRRDPDCRSGRDRLPTGAVGSGTTRNAVGMRSRHQGQWLRLRHRAGRPRARGRRMQRRSSSPISPEARRVRAVVADACDLRAQRSVAWNGSSLLPRLHARPVIDSCGRARGMGCASCRQRMARRGSAACRHRHEQVGHFRQRSGSAWRRAFAPEKHGINIADEPPRLRRSA